MKKSVLARLILLVLLVSATAQADGPHRFMDIAPGTGEAAVVATLATQGVQLAVKDAIYPSALTTRPGQVTLYGMPALLRVGFTPSAISYAQYEVSLDDFQSVAASASKAGLLESAITYTQLLIEKLTDKYGAPTGGSMYTGAGDSALWDYPGDARTGKLDAGIMQRLVNEETLVDITLGYKNISLNLMWESYDGISASPDGLDVSIRYDYQWGTESVWYVAGFAQGYGPYSEEGKAAYLEDLHRWEEEMWGDSE